MMLGRTDSLLSLARRSGGRLSDLLRDNPVLSAPDSLEEGMEIKRPEGSGPSTVAAALNAAMQRGQSAAEYLGASGTGPPGTPRYNCCSSEHTEAHIAQTPLLQPTDGITAEDHTEFGKEFEGITGMTVSQSIRLYQADTGETLTPEKVKTLFSDAEKAQEILMADKNLHTRYRDILNSNVPATREEAIKAGYIEQPAYANLYHDPWNNTKFLGPNGHLEAVYDSDGNIVTSAKHKGTFNFFPAGGGMYFWSDHRKGDVKPYSKWGN